MPTLWSKEKEIEFFNEARKFANPEQLFYFGYDSRYYAYWPKNYKGKKSTLQSRNSLIGKFTEKFSVDLLQEFAFSKGYYVVQDVICEEIGLSNLSPADVVISEVKTKIQKASDLIIIFEVKMSVVWNWELKDDQLICLGDYKTHSGNPGLLRSDTMLKAIGKSINIRVSGHDSSSIPIIILGNTPITESYITKVDHLFNAGIIQGFWSVNPNPLDNERANLKKTDCNGFIRMDSFQELYNQLEKTVLDKKEFFSSMKSKNELGKIIEIANKESSLEEKAEKFLSLLRNYNVK